MPSVDVVSRVDMQAMDNAVNNLKREIQSRYDFKNVTTEIELDRKTNKIHVQTGDEMKINAVIDILQSQCLRLKLEIKCLEIGEIEATSHGALKVDIGIKEGISQDTCRQMTKLVKGGKMKVQAAIMGDHLRLTGKKIDDLQAVMQMYREQDYDMPIQFVNMKSD